MLAKMRWKDGSAKSVAMNRASRRRQTIHETDAVEIVGVPLAIRPAHYGIGRAGPCGAGVCRRAFLGHALLERNRDDHALQVLHRAQACPEDIKVLGAAGDGDHQAVKACVLDQRIEHAG
nr:hypothetical protein [Pelagivirga sediminicola]